MYLKKLPSLHYSYNDVLHTMVNLMQPVEIHDELSIEESKEKVVDSSEALPEDKCLINPESCQTTSSCKTTADCGKKSCR